MSVTPSPLGGFAAQFFDNNGVILSGGTIYTYSAGTTTPQAAYTSASGATPHANPIVLDSAGRVPGGEIWLTKGLDYKFIIKTSTGVLTGTYNNLQVTPDAVDASLVSYEPPFTGSVATNVENKLAQYVSVKDFGAVGDGVADDTAAIQNAIDYSDSTAVAITGTAEVYFPAGVYKVTSGLTVSRSLRFIGGGWPIIKVAHNTDAITLTGIPSAVLFPRNVQTFEGLVFNTQSGFTPTSVIRLGTSSGLTPTYINSINDVKIVNCVFDQITAAYVIDNNRGFGLVIQNCAFTDITATAVLKMRQTQTEIPYWTYAVNIYASDFTNITGKAIEADGGDLTVFGSIIEGCSAGAVDVGINTAYTGAQPTNFYGTYFEANQVFHYRSNNGRVLSNFNGCKFVKGSAATTRIFLASASACTFTACSTPNQAPTITGGNLSFSGCNYMQGTTTATDSVQTDRYIAYTSTPTTAYSLNGVNGYEPIVFGNSPGLGGGGVIMLCSHSGFPAAGNSVVETYMIAKRQSGAAVDAVSLGRYENGDTSTFSFGVDASGFLTVTSSQAGSANYALVSQSKYPVALPG